MICFTVYSIPVAKGRPRFARFGKFVKAYTPKKTEQYEEGFLAQAIKHKPDKPIETPLSVNLRFFFPIPLSMPKKLRAAAEGEIFFVPKKPDIDNLIKSVLDPLNGIFWVDDKLVVNIQAEKRYSVNPRIEVKIETYQEALEQVNERKRG